MSHIITLASSATPGLSGKHFETVNDFLKKASVKGGSDIQWLLEGRAGAITADKGLDRGQIRDLRKALDSEQVDVFCTPAENRKKKLLIADMDGTIVDGESLDVLAEKAGLGDKISKITERAMNGELNFEEALKERVAMLKGVSVKLMVETATEMKLTPGAKTLVKTMKGNGAICVLVTGGFKYFSHIFGNQAGFNKNHANRLATANDEITGEIAGRIIGREAKLDYFKQYIEENNLKPEDTMAIGDGANDLDMLKHAGLAIGYKPKPILEEHLDHVIRYSDLRTALFVQGYSRGDFSIDIAGKGGVHKLVKIATG